MDELAAPRAKTSVDDHASVVMVAQAGTGTVVDHSRNIQPSSQHLRPLQQSNEPCLLQHDPGKCYANQQHRMLMDNSAIPRARPSVNDRANITISARAGVETAANPPWSIYQNQRPHQLSKEPPHIPGQL
jgi:hypothetical protein